MFVRERRASNIKSLVSGVHSPLWSHPHSEVRVARQLRISWPTQTKVAVFRPLSLSEAYLGAIEKEAFVTLRYSQTLPLAGNKSLQENATECEGQRGWQH